MYCCNCLSWSEWGDSNSQPHGPKPRALPVAPHPDNYLRKLHLGRTFSWAALHNTRRLQLVCVANRTSHYEILSFIHSSGLPNECPSRLRGTLSALPLTALLTASLPTYNGSTMSRSTANINTLTGGLPTYRMSCSLRPIGED